jgi:hypothetical protein
VVVGSQVSDTLSQIALKNICLGVTVPTAGLDTTLSRAAGLITAQFVQAFQGSYYSDIKLWFEPCSSPAQADTVVPVYLRKRSARTHPWS